MATVVRRKRRPAPEPDDVEYDPPGRGESAPKPDRAPELPAIYLHQEEGRRIDLLELLAWAICHIEAMDRDQVIEFGREMVEVREREWGPHPWSGAKRPERFLTHVGQMAKDFTTNPVRYRNRNRQPNPALD